MPIYSFGLSSPVKLSISEEDAESFNRLNEKLWEVPLTPVAQQQVYEANPEDLPGYWRVVETIFATLASMGEMARKAQIEGKLLVRN